MGRAQKLKAARAAARAENVERRRRRRKLGLRVGGGIVGLSLVLTAALLLTSRAEAPAANQGGTAMTIETEKGTIQLELYPGKAPNHVARITELARRGFYNGLSFHRVVPGFVVQTGDPKGDGSGGSDLPDLKFEPNDLKHDKGVIAMARAQSKDSANSQFYITLAPQPSLDGQYVVFGRVTSGMEVVERIVQGDKMTEVVVP